MTSNQVHYERTAERKKQHEHATAIDRVAEGKEAACELYPASNLYPGEWRMTIPIGINSDHPIQDGPGARHVGAFVQFVAWVIEHVIGVGPTITMMVSSQTGTWTATRVIFTVASTEVCISDFTFLLLSSSWGAPLLVRGGMCWRSAWGAASRKKFV